MATIVALDQLLANRQVRRGGASLPAAAPAVSTGIAALDELLPDGGWPARSLAEVLIGADGSGEAHLVLPVLRAQAALGRQVALVGPPLLPYAPAWQAHGMDLSQLQLVRCASADAPWAMEQCLRAGHFAVVIGWLATANDHILRRLVTAASVGNAVAIAIRPLAQQCQPSPAPLRVALEAPAHLRILKCRGSHPPGTTLQLPAPRLG